MITGHVGIAAAVRSGWRDASLLWLLPACVAPDLLDVAYALVGFCSPLGLYSHTVPVVALLSAALGGAAYLATRSRTTALATAAVVLLHLPADMITGNKYFWPGAPVMGLDLYRHHALDFVLESIILVGGWWLLRRDVRAPRWATTSFALGGLLLVQGTLDSVSLGKPSACQVVSAPR